MPHVYGRRCNCGILHLVPLHHIASAGWGPDLTGKYDSPTCGEKNQNAYLETHLYAAKIENFSSCVAVNQFPNK